jgi:pilus assembly protein CpaC
MCQVDKKFIRSACVLIATALLALPWAATAQDSTSTVQPKLRAGSSQNLEVPLFKSRVIKLAEPAARISVGSPDIADILILRATQLYVLGKDLGTTNVLLWDRNDFLIGTVSVEVTHDLDSLKEKIHTILPDENINVYATQRNIVMSGRVSSVGVMDAALRMADGYLAQVQTSTKEGEFDQGSRSRREDKAVGEVVNLMQVGGGQQVMLSVKIAEINREELRSLDVQWNAILSGVGDWSFGGTNGGAGFPGVGPLFNDGPGVPLGPALTEFVPDPLSIGDKGFFTSYIGDDFLFNMALNAAKNEGLAKILAEPTLTTLTGQQAEFLSGGEFPIPVPQDNNSVTIEFKQFGVGVRFLPVVLGPDRINLKINVDVSEINQFNSVLIDVEDTNTNFFVPSLTKRSAESTVELKDGQTIGIAGLISENLKEAVDKFPGLGELPILGALFRSQTFLKGETELMIMVTPTLAKPIAPQDIRLPTDSFVEPSERDFYLFGRMEGRQPESEDEGEAEVSETAVSDGGAEGTYGQDVNWE